MTFVATMENRKLDGGEIWSIHKHNAREELGIVKDNELKLMQNTSIDASLSKNNKCFKRMSWDKLKALKEKPHRKNTAGAFEIVFSMQNENAKLNEEFDVNEHKKLIENFLNEFGITSRFDVLEFVYHGDEGIGKPHHHFHITLSGWDNSLEEGKFNINGFFSPVIAEAFQYDNKGNQLFKKIDKGKDRGKLVYNDKGKPIPKTKPIRSDGMQNFQNAWELYLLKNTKYWNKKPYTSMLQIPKSLYKTMSHEDKIQLFNFRELEKIKYEHLFFEEYQDQDLLDLINKKMNAILMSLNEVLETEIINDAIQRNKKLENTKKKILTPSI